MLRIIVADDEYLVRERVKRCVDWASFGFEICGEAANGRDAIALVEEVSPHIIITDINMPYINGLDLSMAVRGWRPKIKIVVLTGYSSFDYARTAMHAGVSQYILKPINQNELLEAMLALKAQIERENQMEQYVERLKNDSRLSRSAHRQQLFQEIVEHSPGFLEQGLREQFAEAYPALSDGALVLALIELHYKSIGSLPAEDRQLWRYAASNILEEVCGKIAHIEFVNINGNKIAALMNITETDTPDTLAQLCKTAQNHIYKHLGTQITIGISNEINGFDRIARAYRQAGRALRQRYMAGCGSIIRYETAQKKVLETHSIGTDLLIYIRTGNIGAACSEVRRILADGAQDMETLYLILSELVLLINAFIMEKEIDMSGLIENDFTADGLLDQNDDLTGLEENIIYIVQQLVTRYNQNHLLGYAGLIARTKRYIEENFADKDICLETIAVNISVNPCYLSSVFKKESGFSIVEYLTKYRMQVAKRLINENGARLSEVADAVGFNDPYYFSKCFKKTFGMAPSHYLKTK